MLYVDDALTEVWLKGKIKKPAGINQRALTVNCKP